METILVKAAGLALMIFAGYGLKRLGVFRTEDAKVISRIVVHLTLPAALITGFRTFHFDASYLALIVIALVSNFALLGVGVFVFKVATNANRMARLAAGFDLTSDQGRIDYAAAAADLLAELPNAVEREIYTTRAAASAGISPDALKLEVQRSSKRRGYRQRREQEKRDLNVAAQVQPKERAIRYDNLRSAMAEEGVLRLLCTDDSVFGDAPPLREEEFSSPLLGRLFARLWQQRQESGRISLPLLAESFTPDEVSHLSTIVQKPESLKNAPQALRDYIRIIQEEYQKRSGAGLDPLAAATEKYKAQLGHGGKQHG